MNESKILHYHEIKLKKLLRTKNIYKKFNLDLSKTSSQFFKEYCTKLPITSKESVKNNPKSFLTRKPKLFDLRFFTSGSTGSPMMVFVSWKHWIIEQAVVFRHWKWHGYKFRDTCAMIRSYAPKNGEPLIKYNWALNTYYYSPFHLDEKNMEIYYHHMLNKGVKYLRGYPTTLKIFAQFCRNRNYKLPRLKFILSASEVLTVKDRQLIQETFNVKIGNHYGLAEQIVMFGNCKNSNLLHNYNEYGFCELIPTDEKDIYKIIGTNLHNDLMPLLRYDTGDLAYVKKESFCSCNRKGVVVEDIIGRKDVLIKDNHGNSIPTVNFYTLLHSFLNIDQWQISLSNDNVFTLLYTGSTLSIKDHENLLSGLKQRLVNTKFITKIEKTTNLNRIAEGKTPRIYYEN